MELLSFSVQNLRSFAEKVSVPVKPITLLVGANSCGKSSLLRLLPLLRQSVETKTKGPILWYGPYVDFGSFADALPNSQKASEIFISLGLKLHKTNGRPPYHRVQILDDIEAEILIGIRRDCLSDKTYTSRIQVTIDGHVVVALLNPAGLVTSYSLNGEELLTPAAPCKLLLAGSLFSLSFLLANDKKQFKAPWLSQIADIYFLDVNLLKYIRCLFHGSTIDATRRDLIRRLGVCSHDQFISHLLAIDKASKTTLENLKIYSANRQWTRYFQGLFIAARIPILLSDIDANFSFLLRQVRYLGPVRASASRFYRQQDLATDEVDSEGSNMAMFLAGLSPEERESFSSWCDKEMGFAVSVISESSHVSIKIKDDNSGTSCNIADMGFGYSQMLPLLVTLWASYCKHDKPRSLDSFFRVDVDKKISQTIHLVEQPELHLHPRYQAKLADLYCKLATRTKDKENQISFIIETHSETMINRIGALVYDKVISPNDIAVLVAEKNSNTSSIIEAHYDCDGMLTNWPYGFFLPDL